MSANKNKKVGDDLSVCVLNILPKGSNLPSFFSYKPPERGDIDFSNIYVTSHWPLDQKVMSGSTLPSVVLISLLQVEICISSVA